MGSNKKSTPPQKKNKSKSREATKKKPPTPEGPTGHPDMVLFTGGG